jgi:hypothetical protein
MRRIGAQGQVTNGVMDVNANGWSELKLMGLLCERSEGSDPAFQHFRDVEMLGLTPKSDLLCDA